MKLLVSSALLFISFLSLAQYNIQNLWHDSPDVSNDLDNYYAFYDIQFPPRILKKDWNYFFLPFKQRPINLY